MYPKTFEEACTITGDDPTHQKFSTGAVDEISFKKLKVETDATNRIDNDGKPWVPDWTNYDERKWQAWWDLELEDNNPSGFRFNGSHYDYASTRTPVGLCYKSEAGLKNSVNSFLEDWKSYITGK
jgi:hypothetical protein